MLNDIADKYNTAVHKTIKMKPIVVTDVSYAECNKDFNKKDPKFKFGDHVRIWKLKTFLLKDTHQIGQMEFLLLVKLKTQFLGITGNLCKKELKKTNQKEFRIKEILKEKVINCTSNGKGMIIVLIVWLITKISYKNE